ncbi:polysaccharide pyruvyl transferase family protein [Mangrovibacterium diazotrophicum]|uniref:Polysaccharide pyruvyl transferase n=1 Tax=Mangrovibacterium diazotrophicum TaxID=1261403 RepID=A0A419W944_9BACT|nr:polysaccharide pyruvyl transferase family protein [Mangrovibacterium diazotrophicum]RKD91969.1 polysaccharide pyruvyl transferase [Mangrovibacterium diazotrophicum]
MKNTKIGILTLPFNYNYGGILQTYALQRFLIANGYDTYHIYRDFPEKNKATQIIKDLIKLIIGKNKKTRFEGTLIRKFFDEKVVPKTHRIRTLSDLKKLHKYGFTTFIVGSDQVWRKACIYGDLKTNYFLDFPKDDVNRISYAASFGVDNWEFTSEETVKLKTLLQKFSAVSVRENSGIKLCEEHMGVAANHVPDPVWLLKAEDYRQLIAQESERTEVNGECLAYVLDSTDEKKKIIQDAAEKLGYQTFTISYGNNGVKPSVITWLKAFAEAKFVVTDSFHGCVFSILFNKPFLVIGNITRGLSRFSSVLSELNLENRMIFTEKDDYLAIVGKPIDWDTINKEIEEKRAKARNFIFSSIK